MRVSATHTTRIQFNLRSNAHRALYSTQTQTNTHDSRSRSLGRREAESVLRAHYVLYYYLNKNEEENNSRTGKRHTYARVHVLMCSCVSVCVLHIGLSRLHVKKFSSFLSAFNCQPNNIHLHSHTNRERHKSSGLANTHSHIHTHSLSIYLSV